MRPSLRPTLSSTPSLLGELVASGDHASPLPLEHLDVEGQVTGMLASFSLAQRFVNPFAEPVELVYRFAIPHQAALAGFTLKIGARSIEGEVAPREAATEQYQEALAAGQRAALTTEERPNLYTVQIGNVQPGEPIIATYRYSLQCSFDGGQFELALPFGVTPRYHRPDESPAKAAATDVVIAPLGAPLPDLDVSIAIDAGVAIAAPTSPSHQIAVTRLDARRCQVRLVEPRVPNKDFVLRYTVEAVDNQVLSAAWRTALDDDELVYAVFVPPAPDQAAIPATPREYVFVLDRSGSMSGEPIAQARNALRACLRSLTPEDTFRIVLFDNRTDWFESSRERALAFTDQTLEVADRFLDTVEGRGGTELLPALEEVIGLPEDPQRQRVIVLLTDGAISAEERAAAVAATLPSRDRLFCFGIGPSVNRYLLDRLARAGRGVAEVVGLDEDIEGAIIRFQDRLSYPVLTDLRVELDGAAVKGLLPEPLPDLYAGQALHVVARLGARSDMVDQALRLRGRRGDADVVIQIREPRLMDEPLIRRLWAQQRIDAMLGHDFGRQDRAAIEALSRDFQILTPFTALLAVDREVTNAKQKPRKIIVATPLPEGVTFGWSGIVMHNLATGLHTSSVAYTNGAYAPSPASRVSETLSLHSSAISERVSGRGMGGWHRAKSESSARPGPDDLLRRLVRTQRASGAWDAEGGTESAELTAAAVVAFARAGHTPNRGAYRRPLRRALDWLEANARTSLDRQFLQWARAEVSVANGERPVANLARRAAADSVEGDNPALAAALIARLAYLAGTGAASPRPGDAAEFRIAAILDDAPPTTENEGISLPWRACLAAAAVRVSR